MQSYKVRWEIDVEAESPVAAAKDVWMRNFGRSYPPAPDSCCTFKVCRAEPLGAPFENIIQEIDLERVAQDEGLEPAADDRPAPYSPYLIALLAGYSRLMQSLQGDGQDYVPRLKEVTEAIGRLGDPSGIPTPVDRIHADIPELVGKRSELIEVFCYLRNVARQRGDSEAMAEAALTIANLRQALREPAIPVTVDVSKLDLDVLAKALAESGPLTLQRSPAPTVVNGIALTPAELNYTLMALEHLQDFHDTEPGRDWGITDPEIDYLHQRLSGRSTADTRFTKEQPKP